MEISAVAAIKKYMELNGDRSVTMEEMKAPVERRKRRTRRPRCQRTWLRTKGVTTAL